MQIEIKRIDKEIPLPAYETEGSVCFDFRAREETRIPPRSIVLVPGNVIVNTPPGYMLLVAPRSSTPRKKGLLSPHGIGIIDQDYCGEKDEIMIQLYNFTDEEVVVEKGERIAQGGFVRIDRASFVEVEKMSQKSRGGFGSTDTHVKYCID